ncbi:folylpolyglutamate synthase [Scheffersomyces spartinae]|uniref:Dihydrofolate synthetase n=1 Tax=Scheffersomyces spartinae TaxID=45513 RepID=A0A9P7V759_9ASCO|nr:folylpolyglutamate synthase [Scheffersomyces spartinae]KAG7192620.1 folylpolyglutamate synthase [Scheffersomyces spartinae]
MGIDLGLARVLRLLVHLGNPHMKGYKSIHIAGTNGKGSTVAYLSLVFTSNKVKNGRFTSPHMLYYNDCVAINNQAYPIAKFERAIETVRKHNEVLRLGCTEFEILTVTAFKIFADEQVQVAIVEVGLGGRLDATNVLEPFNIITKGGLIATGISKIAMDHESFLGSTLARIASEKAGIIKHKVPCTVDGTNEPEVLKVIEEKCTKEDAPLTTIRVQRAPDVEEILNYSPLQGEYQYYNLSVALSILSSIRHHYQFTKEQIIEGIRGTKWPGRLQSFQSPAKHIPILLDGAHNESAALELGKFLSNTYRKQHPDGLRFVIALTQGKDADGLLKHIIDPSKDHVFVTQFTAPIEMPWIKPLDPQYLAQAVEKYTTAVTVIKGPIESVIATLENQDELLKTPIVICGSLYLCGDVLRLYQPRD